MQRSNDDSQNSLVTGEKIGRRGFLKRCLLLAGGVAAWWSGSREATAKDSGTVAPVPSPVEGSLARRLPAKYQGYPVPTHVPPDFKLVEIYTDRPDGFGSGSEELAFWYQNPRSVYGYNNPLAVFVARHPSQPTLLTTKGQSGIPLAVSNKQDDTLQVLYHDGFWVRTSPASDSVSWNTTNVHSVCFALREFTIGIRGSRLTGCDVEQLLKVAASIS